MISGIDIIGILGSIETLESGIREIISDAKNKHDNTSTDRKLDSLDIYFREEIARKISDVYTAEKLDDFMASYSDNFKPDHDLDLFSTDDIRMLKMKFYEKSPELKYKEKEINHLIDRYVEELNKALNEKLDFGTKVLSQKIDQSVIQISRLMEESFASINVDAKKSGKDLMDAIEAVLAFIKTKTDHDFRTEVKILDNYLTYSGLDDLVLKLPKLFSMIDKQKIESITDICRETEIESFHAYVSEIASDFSVETNSFFNYKIVPILEFLKAYEHKSPQYYWAIGKMGLEINEDDKMCHCLLDNLELYFLSIYRCLKNKWQYVDYEKADTTATLNMHDHILNRIGYYLDPPMEQLIRRIYDNKRIVDQQLAEDAGMTVKELRRLLYPATKSFLMYEYVDDRTTMLSIKGQYMATMKYYFERGNGA